MNIFHYFKDMIILLKNDRSIKFENSALSFMKKKLNIFVAKYKNATF